MELQKTDSYAKAYVEILEIINHMEEKYRKKIPSNLLNFFEEKKDPDYIFDIDNLKNDSMTIFSNETIGLLSMLELKYWGNDNEKKVLEKALIDNERKYQKELNEKYNPDNLFKNKEVKFATVENSVGIVEYKDSIFTKIKNWFKRLFCK